ncbi:hypothetical protein HPB48_025492 [Haemaphysalis longicornis]|uniref:Uncharacterized protein n=1 Tax=Haemaphysalis longicornis TaxID=44386 RepID=A0A9J6H7N4_HAELO|nr:hypothetical protein HPB48_025492 [Haemaphysalis longicornis]
MGISRDMQGQVDILRYRMMARRRGPCFLSEEFLVPRWSHGEYFTALAMGLVFLQRLLSKFEFVAVMLQDDYSHRHHSYTQAQQLLSVSGRYSVTSCGTIEGQMVMSPPSLLIRTDLPSECSSLIAPVRVWSANVRSNGKHSSPSSCAGQLSPLQVAGISMVVVACLGATVVSMFFCYYVYKKNQENLAPSQILNELASLGCVLSYICTGVV